MFCPRCSKQIAIDTSFCRTCGLSLGGVAQIVKGEAETEPEIRTGPNSKLVRAGVGSVALGFAIGLSTPILKSLGLFGAAVVTADILLVMIVIGILILGFAFVFPQKRYIRQNTKSIPANDHETRALDTGRLDQLPPSDRSLDDFTRPEVSREPGSVTEDTTRQLR